jgi:hypothetical protein
MSVRRSIFETVAWRIPNVSANCSFGMQFDSHRPLMTPVDAVGLTGFHPPHKTTIKAPSFGRNWTRYSSALEFWTREST